MKNIKQIVQSLGGTTKVAKICNVSPPAVSQWVTKNRIPKTAEAFLTMILEQKKEGSHHG